MFMFKPHARLYIKGIKGFLSWGNALESSISQAKLPYLVDIA